MNLADLLKKNIVMVPVVASVLVGTFTGVKYIVNLTDTINANQAQIEKIQTEDTIKVDKNSNTSSQLQISSSEEKQLKSSHSWQNINFKKTTKKSNLKSFSNNLSNPKNETIEVEFRLLLDSWLKQNLNKLIELEISNYIKNRQN